MDAFENAVSQVRGDDADVDAGEQPASSSSSPAPAPGKSRRGGRRPGAGRPRKTHSEGSSAHTGAVNGPPAPDPEQRPDIKPIDPAAVAQVLRRLDQLLVAVAETDPVGDRDLQEGGVAFAPIFDHYAPQLLGTGEGAMWMAPTLWVVAVYGPRAMDAWERKRGGKRLDPSAQEMPTPSGGAAPGAGFSESDARHALTLGYVARPVA